MFVSSCNDRAVPHLSAAMAGVGRTRAGHLCRGGGGGLRVLGRGDKTVTCPRGVAVVWAVELAVGMNVSA